MEGSGRQNAHRHWTRHPFEPVLFDSGRQRICRALARRLDGCQPPKILPCLMLQEMPLTLVE
jgi:hypothetical protein